MTDRKKKQGNPGWRAYALVKDRKNPSTWQLLHHGGGAADGSSWEDTVDWELMGVCVAMLSRMGHRGVRLRAEENEKLAAARHLAAHYRHAGRPLPNALAVLV